MWYFMTRTKISLKFWFRDPPLSFRTARRSDPSSVTIFPVFAVLKLNDENNIDNQMNNNKNNNNKGRRVVNQTLLWEARAVLASRGRRRSGTDPRGCCWIEAWENYLSSFIFQIIYTIGDLTCCLSTEGSSSSSLPAPCPPSPCSQNCFKMHFIFFMFTLFTCLYPGWRLPSVAGRGCQG